ncbi:MAG: phosphoglycerate kinase [Flavobacteriaceae bacterium]
MIRIEDQNFEGKTVLVRVDFNVPLNDAFQVTDATRIHAARPTLNCLIEGGAKCVLFSHLGRPKGVDPQFSLSHIVSTLSEVLGQTVMFCEKTVGEEAAKAVAKLKTGEVLLMENLRFHPEETQGDRNFAQALASLGDAYVNDAFGTAHRAHASTAIIAEFFPKRKYFGLLMRKEVEAIAQVMENGENPVLAIIGGAKVSSKLTILESLLDKIDDLIIGGGMVYTFIQAQGGKIGTSICEPDLKETALDLLAKAKAKKVRVHLPIDVKIADAFDPQANTKIVDISAIPEKWMALDCGPESLKQFGTVVQQARTILWNGPLGVFEMEAFAQGTIGLGQYIAQRTKQGAFSLVGGGDSVAAVKQFGFESQMSYVSTGGGAMLESLEGKELPGIAALQSD